MRIRFTATGLTELSEAAKQAGGKISDLREFAPSLFLLIQSDIDERFRSAPGVRETGQVYGGVEWPNLTEAYLSQNPRRESGQQLRDTGELNQSFQVGGYGNIADANKRELTFGTSLPKAAGLHKKRPLVVVHSDLVEAMSNLITGEFIDSIEQP